MADFTALKTAIQNAIKQNGNEEITGNLLQDVLLAIVTTLGEGNINNLINSLDAEVTARQQAVSAEAQARQLADSTLQEGINTVSAAITAINNAIGNGCVYAGIATPSSTPASGKVFYLALTAGTYTNYGGLEVPQGINILKNNGSIWSLDSFLGIDNAPTPSSNNLIKSGGAFDFVMKNGSAFDLSAYNNGTTYADLNAALTALNALPAAYKKGGMSLKYVQTSDNKYVQYRYMSSSTAVADFANVANWQGVEEELSYESDNIAKSRGVLLQDFQNSSLYLSDANYKQGYYRGNEEFVSSQYRITTGVIKKPNGKVYIYCKQGYNVSVFHGNQWPMTDLGWVISNGGIYELDVNSEKICITISTHASTEIHPSDASSVNLRLFAENSIFNILESYIAEDQSDTQILKQFLDYNNRQSAGVTLTWSKIINQNGTAESVSGYLSCNPAVHFTKGTLLLVYAKVPVGYNVITWNTPVEFVPVVISQENTWKWYRYVVKEDCDLIISSAATNFVSYKYSTELWLDVLLNRDNLSSLKGYTSSIASLILPWDAAPEYDGWVDGNSKFKSFVGKHKVYKVHEGDKILIGADINSNWYKAVFVKSYHIPKDIFDINIDATDSDSLVLIKYSNVLVTAPTGANYLIITSRTNTTTIKPSKLSIGEIDCIKGLSGGNNSIVDMLLPVGGSIQYYTSQFILYKDRTYKISFEGENVTVDEIGNWLYVAIGSSVVVSWRSASAIGPVTLPEDFTFTPIVDSTIYVICKISEGCHFDIKVNEVSNNVVSYLKETDFAEQLNTIKGCMVENMMLSGCIIDEHDDTNCYIQSHHFDNDGWCYVAGFTSKTLTGESGQITQDWRPVLIIFNLADPINTKETYYMYNFGDRIFANDTVEFSYCNITTAAKINSTTIRVMSLINGGLVYKDFSLTTKQFEQYGHLCTVDVNDTVYNITDANGFDIVTAADAEYFSQASGVIAPGNPVLIDGYYYQVISFYNYSHVLCKTSDYANWEVVSDIPLGYLSDEVQLCHLNGRIYAAATGNISRRPDGTFDQMIYYDLETGEWSEPITFGNYGHDYVAMASVDGLLYSLHTVIGETSTHEWTRLTNYVDGQSIARSVKDLVVFDQDMNVVKKIHLAVRRAMVTTSFASWAGNLYVFAGSNPKGIPNSDGRQNCIFSFVDVRLLNL